MNAKMRTLRVWLTRTPYTLSVCAFACSVYEPSLLTSGRPSASGGALDGQSGGSAGQAESTGGRVGSGGNAAAGSGQGASTGGSEGGAASDAGAGGTFTFGGNAGGALTSGGSAAGGDGASGGKGGSASTGGTATGGSASNQGGSGGVGGAAPSCAGALYQGLCWYLGPRGASCDATCAAHGGPATGAETFVGTTAQGGSVAECQRLLVLFGVTAAPVVATRDDVGLGCHLYADEGYWLDEPNFSSDASVPAARIVCACRLAP